MGVIVFYTLSYPDRQLPVAKLPVKVSAAMPAPLAEGREVIFTSTIYTDANGVYTLNLDVLPTGNYHIIEHPYQEQVTVLVPTGNPPHDTAHLVPGTASTYGWRVDQIRQDAPGSPVPLPPGVRSVSGVGVDNTDPANPVLPFGGQVTALSTALATEATTARAAELAALNAAGSAQLAVTAEATTRAAADASIMSHFSDYVTPLSAQTFTSPQQAQGRANIGAAPASGSNFYPNVPQVADLTYPLFIAHRGLADLFVENTMESYRGALAVGAQAIEAGDLQLLADGALACIHDTTTTRTTGVAGTVGSFTTAGIRRLTALGSILSANTPNTTVPTFAEVLAGIGGRVVIVPEIKDGQAATATNAITAITALGLTKNVIIQSFALPNLVLAQAAGIATMLLMTTGAEQTPATLVADGVSFVGIPVGLAGLSTFVASMHAVGIKVIAYTIDRQGDWAVAQAAGCDGAFTNEALYISPANASKYRQTVSRWGLNGTWGHGQISTYTGDGGPFTTAMRGDFVGVAGAWRWQPAQGKLVIPGELCPIAAAAGSYTLTIKYVFDTIPTTVTLGPKFYIAAPTDVTASASADVPSSYCIVSRANGTQSTFVIDSGGSATAKGAPTSSTVQNPVLSSGLTSGVAITSLPVNALTAAVQIGHQFLLPTGQVATATATATIGGTAITVSSITPSAAVASAAVLLQVVTVTVAVSPTTVIVSRTDGTVATTTITDATTRGAYFMLDNATSAGNGQCSFLSVTVT